MSWDLDTALRCHEELAALLGAGASVSELKEAIGHMVLASEAAEMEQKALLEQLEQHIFQFRRLLRWRTGVRPLGVNASLSEVVGESHWGDQGAPKTKVMAICYAELWHQQAQD